VTDGRLVRDGEAYLLRFERELPHPVERVWQALTQRTDLAAWFPSGVDLELRVGGKVTFVNDPDFDIDSELLATTGEVVELDPPRAFAFTWGGDLLRFELSPIPAGCRMVFTHRLPHRACANRTVAGWSVCLAALTTSLAGSGADGSGWHEYYDHYVQELGEAGVITREGEATVLRFERLLSAPAATVWSAITDPARWDEVSGGPGEVLRTVSLRAVEYRWASPGISDAVVKWQLIPVGESTLVLLTQTVAGDWNAVGAIKQWEVVLAALANLPA
jgi:uncharacterized protein YndB with AHSA1/START domain